MSPNPNPNQNLSPHDRARAKGWGATLWFYAATAVKASLLFAVLFLGLGVLVREGLVQGWGAVFGIVVCFLAVGAYLARRGIRWAQ